tara:strand:+ start:354 stop:1631 length:1278 start_codon:yes stop_codon:yes gene_type:complete
MKVIELTIDNLDDFGGLDAISIVENPAHNSHFLAFKGDNNKNIPIFEMLGDEGMSNLAFQVSQLGEPIGTLEKDGYVLVSIEDATTEKELFYNSEPNPEGEDIYEPRIRYKYTGEIRDNTRDFCRIMMGSQNIYTEEDISLLSDLNPIGPGGYSALMWRGSFNCLHKWVKLTYLSKDQVGDIRNSIGSVRDVISQETGTQYDTRNNDTIAAEGEGRSKGVSIGPRVGGFSEWFHSDFKVVDVVDDMPLFSTKEEALLLAEKIGCKGFHTMTDDNGNELYMACSEHMKFSFSQDDKMEITGAAIIPNKMIVRRTQPTLEHPQGEFYYVFFTEETIQKLSEKFMREKKLDKTNIEHSDKDGHSYVKESWIIADPEYDKSKFLGLSYPKGTWMITMQVKDKDIWKQIKQGKLNGYSVEGWFNENLLFQ